MELWMEPFGWTIGATKKYVVSGTLDGVEWNAELVRGDLGKAVQKLKREPGKGLSVGGLSKRLDLKLVSWLELASGAVAMRYKPRR